MAEFSREMLCTAGEPREIPGWGVAEPGRRYPFDEAAFATGLFQEKPPATQKKQRGES